MAYHVDCLYDAVSVLAGHGHIKQRLISAYEDHVDRIRDDELPATARQAFADLRDLLHRVAPLNGEGPVCASVRKMSVAEASECAKSIVELYREVARCHDMARQPGPVDVEAPEQVPPFLVKSS